MIPNNIDTVRKMIEEDRYATHREIEASLGISQTTMPLILHECLAVKRFVPDGFHTNLQKLTKRLKQIGVRKCKKNQIGNCKIRIQLYYR